MFLLDANVLIAPKALTDVYLLALAVRKHANFATLDRRIDPDCVTGGAKALLVLK